MPSRRPSPPAWTPTPLQRLVLHAAVLHGRKEAARRLDVTVYTVHHTIERMRQRAGVTSTEQLVYVGVTQGWLRIPVLDRAARL